MTECYVRADFNILMVNISNILIEKKSGDLYFFTHKIELETFNCEVATYISSTFNDGKELSGNYRV